MTRCVLCGIKSQNDFCLTCYNALPWNTLCCERCALPLLQKQPLCGQCLQISLPFEKVLSVFTYNNPIDFLITHFKYHQQLTYGKILSQLLLTKLLAHYQHEPKPQLIISIPLHRKRLIERGFNQSLELAKPLAKALQIPLDYSSSQRIRHTVKQSELALNERSANVRKAFTVKALNVEHVAVVDDVITTGHTMQEFCATLKKAGVKKIDVWCIARTPY